MDNAIGATREELVDAIEGAIRAGGLFSVNVDIIHTQIGQVAHAILPAVEAGEMNLTSMNGERRLRLTEKYMDGPGQALPDCLIAARLAQHMERVLSAEGSTDYAAQFQGYDWQTEEDAFMYGWSTSLSPSWLQCSRSKVCGWQEPSVLGQRIPVRIPATWISASCPTVPSSGLANPLDRERRGVASTAVS